MNKKVIIGIGILCLVFLVIFLLYLSLKPEVKKQELVIENSPALDEQSMRDIEESQRLHAPDIYLIGKMPVVEPTFNIDSYLDNQRHAYVFTVSPKIASLQEVQQNVFDWLLSIGLTEDQINTLIIEYAQEVN